MSSTLINRLKKMKAIIRQATISLASKDSSDVPSAQVKYLGKTADVVRLSPYGLCANAPLGSLGVLITPNGSTSIKYWVGDSVYSRMKNLKEGEVAVYNHLSESYIYFKEDGTIEVDSKKNLDVNISGNVNITVGGNVNVNASGSATVTAPSTTINSTTTLNGNVTVTGTLQSGNITTPAASIGGKDFATHTHGGVETGTSSTGPVS